MEDRIAIVNRQDKLQLGGYSRFSRPYRDKLLTGPVRSFLGIRSAEQAIAKIKAMKDSDLNFFEKILLAYEVRVELDFDFLESEIPKEGPLIVVSNHPFLGPDTIGIASQVARVRPDTKSLANFVMDAFPESHNYFVRSDPMRTKGISYRNSEVVRLALEWLEEGHVLVMNPSGEGYMPGSLLSRTGSEGVWRRGFELFVRTTKSPILPIFVKGQPIPEYLHAKKVHPNLGTPFVLRQWSKLRNKTIEFEVGSLIQYDASWRRLSRGELSQMIRRIVLSLDQNNNSF